MDENTHGNSAFAYQLPPRTHTLIEFYSNNHTIPEEPPKQYYTATRSLKTNIFNR